MSVRVSTSTLVGAACSGLIYAGVPINISNEHLHRFRCQLHDERIGIQRIEAQQPRSCRTDPVARDLVFKPNQPSWSYTLAEALNAGAYEPPRAKPCIGFKTANGR